MDNFVGTVNEVVRGLPQEWRNILLYDGGVKLADVLTNVRNEILGVENGMCSPAPCDIFNAFQMTPLANVKVVLIGQDPYPNPDNAMGLSFSTRGVGTAIPASLRNIYANLVKCGLMREIVKHGDLRYWAKQGVLLLNTALTTRAGTSKTHSNYWIDYMREVFSRIVDFMVAGNGGVVILLGNDARDFAAIKPPPMAPKEVKYLYHGHPSPLNIVNNDKNNPLAFINSTVFSDANTHLTRVLHLAPIDWETNYQVEQMVEFRALNERTLYVFSDGSNNHTGAGWACVVAQGERYICSCATKLQATNNQMELTGIIKGLQMALYFLQDTRFNRNQPLETCINRVVFVTDSRYVIGSLWTWEDNDANTTKHRLIGNVNSPTSTRRENTELIAQARDLLTILRSYVQVESMHHAAHTTRASADTPFKLALWIGNDLCDRKCGSTLTNSAKK
ncbi:uracil-DNA glycosylase family 1 [Faustovirus]|nr:uracil-DNA glycosylase family 1 [Faustovirus]AMN84825.1 uracil-DNA glycosylase family 1 [Faustovirus]AMP44043.1 uracil-DNA glycosylase family 1 [Faustovirus]